MADDTTTRLVGSGTTKFDYRLDAPDGTPRARIRMPTWPSMARNSGLRFGGRDFVEIEAEGASFRLEYETFDARGFISPGYRYFLMAGNREVAVATRPRGESTWTLEAAGRRYVWSQRRRLFGLHFELCEDGRPAGEAVETTRLLRLRRTYAVTLPAALGLPAQAFLFFLAVNSTYR